MRDTSDFLSSNEKERERAELEAAGEQPPRSFLCRVAAAWGASCQGVPKRSADGRRTLGGKWKLGLGGGGH